MHPNSDGHFTLVAETGVFTAEKPPPSPEFLAEMERQRQQNERNAEPISDPQE